MSSWKISRIDYRETWVPSSPSLGCYVVFATYPLNAGFVGVDWGGGVVSHKRTTYAAVKPQTPDLYFKNSKPSRTFVSSNCQTDYAKVISDVTAACLHNIICVLNHRCVNIWCVYRHDTGKNGKVDPTISCEGNLPKFWYVFNSEDKETRIRVERNSDQ